MQSVIQFFKYFHAGWLVNPVPPFRQALAEQAAKTAILKAEMGEEEYHEMSRRMDAAMTAMYLWMFAGTVGAFAAIRGALWVAQRLLGQ